MAEGHKPVVQGLQQVPSIGRIVHDKLPEGRNRGHDRPAIIVRVGDAEYGAVPPESLVQLQVFTDSNNDALDPVIWRTSVRHGEGFGESIWPPHVPAVARI